MSASPDFMTAIMQAVQGGNGLMGSQPQQSGLMGTINQALAPYGGANQVALSLLSNKSGATAPMAAIGQGLNDAQQTSLNNLQKRLQIAQMAMQLPALAFRAKTLNDLSNPAQQSQDASGNPTQGSSAQAASDTQNLPPPLIRNYNTPAQFGASQQTQPPTASPYDQPIVFNGRPLSAQDYQRMLMAFGETPDVAQQKARAEQLAQAQMRIRPQLSVLDPIITSSTNPAAIIQNNAMARQAWQLGAQQYGYSAADLSDPVKVRQALAAGRNLMAASAELPAIDAPKRLNQIKGPLGQRLSEDPITGEIKQEVAPQEVAQFVAEDGKIRKMTNAEGIARDLTPYNPATFVNAGAIGPQAHAIATYRQPAPSSFFLKTAQGQELMKQVYAENPNYDQTQYQTKQKARNAFATGKQGDVVRSLSVATDHLDQLRSAAEAMQNGDIQGVNAVVNWFKTQGGHPEITNFDSMKEIVGDEVAKAVIGSGAGAQGDREGIKAGFAAKGAPAQIFGTIDKYKGLMGGQLNGLRRQYTKSTGLTDFDEMVSDQARSELGAAAGTPPASHPPNIQALLDKYK